MLAKESKIKNLKRQREYIKNQLEYLLDHPRENGDSEYRYLGHILPEVIAYFEKEEGYKVELITSDTLTAITGGMHVYLFTIRDDVILSDEELKMAEEVEYKPCDKDGEVKHVPTDVRTALLRGGHCR